MTLWLQPWWLLQLEETSFLSFSLPMRLFEAIVRVYYCSALCFRRVCVRHLRAVNRYSGFPDVIPMALRSVSLSETLNGELYGYRSGVGVQRATAGDVDNDTGAPLSSAHLWITLPFPSINRTHRHTRSWPLRELHVVRWFALLGVCVCVSWFYP